MRDEVNVEIAVGRTPDSKSRLLPVLVHLSEQPSDSNYQSRPMNRGVMCDTRFQLTNVTYHSEVRSTKMFCYNILDGRNNHLNRKKSSSNVASHIRRRDGLDGVKLYLCWLEGLSNRLVSYHYWDSSDQQVYSCCDWRSPQLVKTIRPYSETIDTNSHIWWCLFINFVAVARGVRNWRKAATSDTWSTNYFLTPLWLLGERVINAGKIIRSEQIPGKHEYALVTSD